MKIKKAFTLIELLVVIAIIALLLSILMPALSLVKEKGKNLSCRANIRSLSIGFRLYAETNNGKVFGYGSSGGNNLWLQYISDEIGNIDKVRYCSSTKRNDATSTAWGSATKTWVWNHGVTEPEHGSYGINGFMYSRTPSGIVPDAEWKLSAWMKSYAPNSASIPVFVDAAWVDLWPQDDDIVPLTHELETGASGGDGANRNHMLRSMIDRHRGALSVSFLDGHVEPVRLSEFWTLKWSKMFNGKPKQFRSDKTTPIYNK